MGNTYEAVDKGGHVNNVIWGQYDPGFSSTCPACFRGGEKTISSFRSALEHMGQPTLITAFASVSL